MVNTTVRMVKEVVAGWKRHGFLPCEIIARDCFPLPIAHGEREARWCVFMTFAEMRHHEGAQQHAGYLSMDGDAYLGEFENRAAADRAVRKYKKLMETAYDAA